MAKYYFYILRIKLKISEGEKLKYLSIFEPESDVVLRAGNKYEFVASQTLDKNLFLRVINIHSGTSGALPFINN